MLLWYVLCYATIRISRPQHLFHIYQTIQNIKWSSRIFTQWGWFILFSPDHFPGQHKNGESPPNYLFLRTFRAGRTYFLSGPFIAAESRHHEESHLIYGPFESILLDQGFPVEHELDTRNPPHTGTPLCRLKLLLCL